MKNLPKNVNITEDLFQAALNELAQDTSCGLTDSCVMHQVLRPYLEGDEHLIVGGRSAYIHRPNDEDGRSSIRVPFSGEIQNMIEVFNQLYSKTVWDSGHSFLEGRAALVNIDLTGLGLPVELPLLGAEEAESY